MRRDSPGGDHKPPPRDFVAEKNSQASARAQRRSLPVDFLCIANRELGPPQRAAILPTRWSEQRHFNVSQVQS
jgi:hypothetical protein